MWKRQWERYVRSFDMRTVQPNRSSLTFDPRLNMEYGIGGHWTRMNIFISSLDIRMFGKMIGARESKDKWVEIKGWKSDLVGNSAAKLMTIYSSDIIGEGRLSPNSRILLHSRIPESHLPVERLSDEDQVLTGAGTASTAPTLGFTRYFVTANDLTRERFSRELKNIMNQDLKFEKLGYPPIKMLCNICSVPEKRFPTLSDGIIRRSFNYGVMHKLPRCSPDGPMRLGIGCSHKRQVYW